MKKPDNYQSERPKLSRTMIIIYILGKNNSFEYDEISIINDECKSQTTYIAIVRSRVILSF